MLALNSNDRLLAYFSSKVKKKIIIAFLEVIYWCQT